MRSPIEVGMGEAVVSENNEAMFVTFVGSCVALCLHDRLSKIGGMAHIMLPQRHQDKKIPDPKNVGKYADVAIEILLQIMSAHGAKVNRIKAKMAGGAQIFSNEKGNDSFNIGNRNIESVKNILKRKGIPLIGEEVGMNHGRWVQFDVHTGEVLVKAQKREIKL